MAIFLSRIKRALNVGSKNITNNGTYYASADGYDGYDEVTVNVSGGSATPITPSNANPVALSSGVAVEPTANGYAIQSYDSVTPSSTPASVASGDIVKIGGNGVIVDSVPSPTSVTPSDSTPPQLSQGNIYEPTTNGYLYATEQAKIKSGSFSLTGSADVSVDCGFKPKYIAYWSGTTVMCIYNEDVSSANWIRASSTGISTRAVGAALTFGLKSVDNNGFSVNKTSSSTYTVYYFACG